MTKTYEISFAEEGAKWPREMNIQVEAKSIDLALKAGVEHAKMILAEPGMVQNYCEPDEDGNWPEDETINVYVHAYHDDGTEDGENDEEATTQAVCVLGNASNGKEGL